MSILSYAELQGAVQIWIARADLAANVADFIALFEATANRRLRVRQMLVTTTLAPSGGDATLPADYLEWKRVTWTGARRRELAYVDPDWLQFAYPAIAADLPNVFTIEGSVLKIRPLDDTALEFCYYQKIPTLSNAAPANWLIAASPDAYLFGALAEAKAFVEDFDGAQVWMARRDAAFAEIDRLSRASQAQASMRTTGPTP